VNVSGCCHDGNINTETQSIKSDGAKRIVPLAFFLATADNSTVSSRETVIEYVRKLPEEMSLAEIAREIDLLAGIQAAREQARRNEGIPAADARKQEDAWAAKPVGLASV
jgi:hypothetical protein